MRRKEDLIPSRQVSLLFAQQNGVGTFDWAEYGRGVVIFQNPQEPVTRSVPT